MISSKKFFVGILMGIVGSVVFAGNPERSGQAGASELLINPWARSSGLHGLSTASTRGIEAMRLNVGGLAFVCKTEVGFARTIWLKGTDININVLGVAQKVGEFGVLGFEIMSMHFGEIEITTTSVPEGGIGYYRPQFLNVAMAYSRAFSNSIFAGAVIRGVSEAIADVRATGVALDAGIQYVTGVQENIKFGIALRNVGTPMRYSGDGLTFRGDAPSGQYQMALQQRSERFEMPALLHIGAAYDIRSQNNLHRITILGNFTSNSFIDDQLGLGVEYALRENFMVRMGYNVEKGVFENQPRTQPYTGFSAGFSIELPLRKNGLSASIDYSYRATNPFEGTHSIGVKMNLGGCKTDQDLTPRY